MTNPLHIAIIPDGNRRWARQHGLGILMGHSVGAKSEHLKSLLEKAKDLGAKYMSLWGFSTENWKRDKKEIEKLFQIISDVIDSLIDEAHAKNIRCTHIGRKDRIPEFLRKKIEMLQEDTQQYEDFHVLIGVDYGGRDEIIRACAKIAAKHPPQLTEETFSSYLDTAGIPDPDLIIRTGGNKRTSGFMPYQSTYSEWHFTETFFPDFGPQELEKVVEEFKQRQRRFGGTR
ncbi:di-trans,poly-cis-decaprenylcistransferase [Candidatus Pacearchaeota archaeon]|nr:di-trans,poly-cis-decaprenylcistransferase [Candidatus Pacearchaeota archaeon]